MTQQQLSPINQLRGQMDSMAPELEKVLPEHITPKQFQRVAMTAIQMNPDLLSADRQSLFSSVMRAAQDGLMPDGREGVLNIFKTKDRISQQWVQKVQWMPMIGGVIKKMHQSGDIKSILVEPVHAGDQFDYWIDDDGAHVRHRPAFGSNKGEFSHMYACVILRSGGRYIEVMDKQELDKIKGLSKSGGNGPWGKFEQQMQKKTILHRLAKRLPLSSDVMGVINSVEEAYEFGAGERDVTPRRPQARGVDELIAPRQQQEAPAEQPVNSYQAAQDGEA